jgi:hypothetical protein
LFINVFVVSQPQEFTLSAFLRSRAGGPLFPDGSGKTETQPQSSAAQETLAQETVASGLGSKGNDNPKQPHGSGFKPSQRSRASEPVPQKYSIESVRAAGTTPSGQAKPGIDVAQRVDVRLASGCAPARTVRLDQAPPKLTPHDLTHQEGEGGQIPIQLVFRFSAAPSAFSRSRAPGE